MIRFYTEYENQMMGTNARLEAIKTLRRAARMWGVTIRMNAFRSQVCVIPYGLAPWHLRDSQNDVSRVIEKHLKKALKQAIRNGTI